MILRFLMVWLQSQQSTAPALQFVKFSPPIHCCDSILVGSSLSESAAVITMQPDGVVKILIRRGSVWPGTETKVQEVQLQIEENEQ